MESFRIEGGHKLEGKVTPSGNKNEALPVLMACLLSEEPIVLHRVPRIGDVLTVCEILQGLGVEVEWQSSTTLKLDARGAHSFEPDRDLCSKVRASILLMGPLLARFGRLSLPLPGGDVIGARRIDTHVDGVEALGAKITLAEKIEGEMTQEGRGTDLYLDEPSVTGTENILLLAVLCKGQTVIHNAAAEPHVTGLCRLLVGMGAQIEGVGSNRLTIQGVDRLGGAEHTIGPDFMEVGSFLCLGAIAKGRIEVENVNHEDLRFVYKTLARIGVQVDIHGTSAVIDGRIPVTVRQDLGNRTPTIFSGPWPAFPTDLMSVAIVAATQAQGTLIFFEKMFEGRMFFTDKLMAMGANIVLCDPHRIVVTGPKSLYPAHLSSPDVRAGMALLMAALIAEGESEIDNIYQIERGYAGIEEKLRSLGARISRVS